VGCARGGALARQPERELGGAADCQLRAGDVPRHQAARLALRAGRLGERAQRGRARRRAAARGAGLPAPRAAAAARIFQWRALAWRPSSVHSSILIFIQLNLALAEAEPLKALTCRGRTALAAMQKTGHVFKRGACARVQAWYWSGTTVRAALHLNTWEEAPSAHSACLGREAHALDGADARARASVSV
jgi:hypothetical protein